MEKMNNKSVTRLRTPLLTLVAASILTGVGSLTEKALSSRETSINCEVYQGYSADNADGYNILIFDSEKKASRMYRPARFPLRSTNDVLPDSLEIGQRYCFEHTSQKHEGAVADLVSMQADRE